MVLVVIILANVVVQILGLSGTVTYATVLFYIMNEGVSIMENLAAVGVLIPKALAV
ncbi:phage holin family protein [Virgibacillus kekensis]|uniref:Phage holin family protein n=1 Tax=Virgibacillus kekensis TaxID=202261 RepID=A0ABV9DG20_9BACI